MHQFGVAHIWTKNKKSEISSLEHRKKFSSNGHLVLEVSLIIVSDFVSKPFCTNHTRQFFNLHSHRHIMYPQKKRIFIMVNSIQPDNVVEKTVFGEDNLDLAKTTSFKKLQFFI